MNAEEREEMRWVVFCAMYPGEERQFGNSSTSELRSMNSRAGGIADALQLAGFRRRDPDAGLRERVEALDKGHALNPECRFPDVDCVCGIPLFDLRAALADDGSAQ